jgi:hypothetical protein
VRSWRWCTLHPPPVKALKHLPRSQSFFSINRKQVSSPTPSSTPSTLVALACKCRYFWLSSAPPCCPTGVVSGTDGGDGAAWRGLRALLQEHGGRVHQDRAPGRRQSALQGLHHRRQVPPLSQARSPLPRKRAAERAFCVCVCHRDSFTVPAHALYFWGYETAKRTLQYLLLLLLTGLVVERWSCAHQASCLLKSTDRRSRWRRRARWCTLCRACSPTSWAPSSGCRRCAVS